MNSGSIIENPDLEINVIGNDGKLEQELGTSFSTPLCSNLFARLNHIYSDVKYVETLKAILLSNCSIDGFGKSYLFKLPEYSSEILYSNKDIILISEGIINSSRTYNKTSRKQSININTIRFYVPKEITKIRIILVHSDNYEFSSPWLIDSNIKMDICKLSRISPLGKDDFSKSLLNQESTIQFVEYICKKAYKGFWDIKLTPGTPRGKDYDIRYGLAIKLIIEPYQRFNNDIPYDEIIREMAPYV